MLCSPSEIAATRVATIRRLPSWLALLALLLLVPAVASAQIIFGTVTDSLSGKPLGLIALSLQDSLGTEVEGTRTDSQGRFSFEVQQLTAFRFVVRKVGARPSSTPIYSIPETADSVQVDLEAPIIGVTLATITVLGEPRVTFNSRQLSNAKASGWRVVEPWLIARSRQSASNFRDLMRGARVAGVRVPTTDSDCFRNVRNRRCLTIVVDGLLLDPYAFINPTEVYFVAYIPANSSLVLYGARAREGALFIATRRQGDDERRP